MEKTIGKIVSMAQNEGQVELRRKRIQNGTNAASRTGLSWKAEEDEFAALRESEIERKESRIYSKSEMAR